MKSPVIKRSIVIAGHKTSVSLEDAFWRGLKEIAIGRDKTLSDLVAEIDTGRPHNNLSSAIRLFVLDHYRAQTNGHAAESKRHQFYGRNKRSSGGAPVSSARVGCRPPPPVHSIAGVAPRLAQYFALWIAPDGAWDEVLLTATAQNLRQLVNSPSKPGVLLVFAPLASFDR